MYHGLAEGEGGLVKLDGEVMTMCVATDDRSRLYDNIIILRLNTYRRSGLFARHIM